jgi:hypothetical protein
MYNESGSKLKAIFGVFEDEICEKVNTQISSRNTNWIFLLSNHLKMLMFLGNKVRRMHRFDNLTAICEPIVCTMWDP